MRRASCLLGPCYWLLDPELVDKDVPLGVPLVITDPLSQEVNLLRVVEVNPWGLVSDLMVNLSPQVVGSGQVGQLHVRGLRHLLLDVLVAELGDVGAGVTAGVDAAAAEQNVQEVRRNGVVLIPR